MISVTFWATEAGAEPIDFCQLSLRFDLLLTCNNPLKKITNPSAALSFRASYVRLHI
jgi:hypothetical protein